MKKENSNKLNKKGFTLLEILVVILIIGILAAIALPQYRLATLKAKYARAKQTANDIRRAYELYYTVHNAFPTKFSDLEFANKLDDKNYIDTSGGYRCGLDGAEISCKESKNGKLAYLINFYTSNRNAIITQCRTYTTDTYDIYNKLCQHETGIIAGQADCNNSYCRYPY